MAASKTPLRILMLHGFTQSGPLFHAKTRALEKHLQKSFPLHTVTLTYPTGPLRLDTTDTPNSDPSKQGGPDNDEDDKPEMYGWWRRSEAVEPPEYMGFERGLETVAKVLSEQGPFDGVIGFSQGAAFAAMLASLLEPGRREAFEFFEKRENNSAVVTRSSSSTSTSTPTSPPTTSTSSSAGETIVSGISFPSSFSAPTFSHPPLKFALCYSGFRAPGARFRAFYENPQIHTPILHVLGSLDAIVEEARSRMLIEACAGNPEKEGKVVWHPGGHFLPCQKPYLDAAVRFMKGCLEGEGVGGKGGKMEADMPVEDMAMPF